MSSRKVAETLSAWLCTVDCPWEIRHAIFEHLQEGYSLPQAVQHAAREWDVIPLQLAPLEKTPNMDIPGISDYDLCVLACTWRRKRAMESSHFTRLWAENADILSQQCPHVAEAWDTYCASGEALDTFFDDILGDE